MEVARQKHVTFVLLTGVLLTVLTIGGSVLLGFFGFNGTEDFLLINAILYALEFGAYCLALYIYLTTISRILWFSQGMSLLIFATLVKIVVSVLVYFVLLSMVARYTVSPGLFFISLFGPFVRGFVIELILLAIAAKIFETDIFDNKGVKDGRVIDDHLK